MCKELGSCIRQFQALNHMTYRFSFRIQALYGSHWVDVMKIGTTASYFSRISYAIKELSNMGYQWDYGQDLPLLNEEYSFEHFCNLIYQAESTKTVPFSLDLWNRLNQLPIKTLESSSCSLSTTKFNELLTFLLMETSNGASSVPIQRKILEWCDSARSILPILQALEMSAYDSKFRAVDIDATAARIRVQHDALRSAYKSILSETLAPLLPLCLIDHIAEYAMPCASDVRVVLYDSGQYTLTLCRKRFISSIVMLPFMIAIHALFGVIIISAGTAALIISPAVITIWLIYKAVKRMTPMLLVLMERSEILMRRVYTSLRLVVSRIQTMKGNNSTECHSGNALKSFVV